MQKTECACSPWPTCRPRSTSASVSTSSGIQNRGLHALFGAFQTVLFRQAQLQRGTVLDKQQAEGPRSAMQALQTTERLTQCNASCQTAGQPSTPTAAGRCFWASYPAAPLNPHPARTSFYDLTD